MKDILNKKRAKGIHCNHRKEEKRGGIMKRPELELSDLSGELY